MWQAGPHRGVVKAMVTHVELGVTVAAAGEKLRAWHNDTGRSLWQQGTKPLGQL